MTKEAANTVKRDTDYGASGNYVYNQHRVAANICFLSTKTDPANSKNCLEVLVKGIEDPKLFYFFPYQLDKSSTGYKAAREGVEDAYLENGLPSPFPNRAPTKDTKKSIN